MVGSIRSTGSEPLELKIRPRKYIFNRSVPNFCLSFFLPRVPSVFLVQSIKTRQPVPEIDLDFSAHAHPELTPCCLQAFLVSYRKTSCLLLRHWYKSRTLVDPLFIQASFCTFSMDQLGQAGSPSSLSGMKHASSHNPPPAYWLFSTRWEEEYEFFWQQLCYDMWHLGTFLSMPLAAASTQHCSNISLAHRDFLIFLVSSQEIVSEPDGAEDEENMSLWALVWFGAQSLTSAQHPSAKTYEYYQTTADATRDWKG